MEQETLKQLKDVFKDYRAINKELLDAKIKSMNLFKKTNSLEIILQTDQNIKIRDVESFENYLKNRFGIKTIKTIIEEKDGIENLCAIEKEWIDIAQYISNKHPMTKAILNNSKITIDGISANIILEFKGKEFLIANKLDSILSEVFENIYGKKYKISFIENVSEDVINRKKAMVEEMQRQAILQVEKETMTENKSNIEIKERVGTVESTVPINSENISSSDIDDKDINIEDEEYLKELEEEDNIILGNLSKGKEILVKIKDIEASNKRITIEGRVISCQARETKSGKGMIIYDIYDGTGVINCKSFSKNIDEANEVLEKIKKASGIKTIRKSRT